MRNEPVIPKLQSGKWEWHKSKNDDGTANGSVVTEDGFCIAKQPRYAEDGYWETHAKTFSMVPDMLKYLIEEYYSLGEKIMECEKILEKSAYGKDKYNVQTRKDNYETKFREVEKILKGAGAFDEDIW